MRKFPRNNLATVSQEWARTHEQNMRMLDTVSEQTDTQIENFSREFHGVLDSLNSEVLFIGNRSTVKSGNQSLTVTTPPSTFVSGSKSLTFQIPTISRGGLFTFKYDVYMTDTGGGIIFGEPWMYMDIVVNGVTVSSSTHGENGYHSGKTGGLGYATVNGPNVNNTVQVYFNTYNFTGSTIVHNITVNIIAQVK